MHLRALLEDLLEASWAVFEASWGSLGPSWSRLGPSWGRLGVLRDAPGTLRECISSHRGDTNHGFPLGFCVFLLMPSCRRLGAVLGRLGVVLGRLGAVLRRSWAVLGGFGGPGVAC